jgi:hypothetical protein
MQPASPDFNRRRAAGQKGDRQAAKEMAVFAKRLGK